MDRNAETRSMKQDRLSLSQETIAILTVGVALASIILVNQGDMRAEGRADREAFAKQINRLLEQQGALSGLVEGLEHAIASPGE